MIVGSPATKAGVEEMVWAYGADEFMAVTIVWSHEARVRTPCDASPCEAVVLRS